jgi:hypothetical protein
MLRFIKIFSLILLLSISPASFAGYLVTGPITAEDCYDFGISFCSTKTVTEVRKDGKRFELPTYFDKVSKYNNSTGRCFINTKSKYLGFLSLAINPFIQPDFWGYDKDSNFGKIDADYIGFNCVPR